MTVAGQSVTALLAGAAGSEVGRSLATALAERGADVLTASDAYDAVVVLGRETGVRLALIGVDALSGRQMGVFAFLHRRRPQMPVVAFGSPASGRRLAEAAAAGAYSILTAPVDDGQLDELLGEWTARPRPPATEPTPPATAPPVTRPAEAKTEQLRAADLLSEAELNALLGDGSDVPVARRPELDFPDQASDGQVEPQNAPEEPSVEKKDEAESPPRPPKRRGKRRKPPSGDSAP